MGYQARLLLDLARGLPLLAGSDVSHDPGATVALYVKKTESLYLIACALLLLFIQDAGYKFGLEAAELAGSSRQLHLEKEYGLAQRGYELGGAYYSYDIEIPVQPGFYPFILSLLHDFTGYRSGQAFVLNALLSLALVYMLALIGRRLWPTMGVWAGPLWALNIPLVPLLANSAGFELLNGCMQLLVIYLLLEYWKSRNGIIVWPVVWTLILLANTRYDALALCALGAALLWQLRKQSGHELRPGLAALVPWALLPVGLLINMRLRGEVELSQGGKSDLWTVKQYLGDEWTRMTDFSDISYVLLPVILLLSVVLFFAKRPGRQFLCGKISSYCLLGLLALGVLAQVRASVFPGNDDPPRSSSAAKANWFRDQVRVHKGQNVLFIVEQPPVVIAEEISAISMKRAASHKAELALHLELKTFTAIYVLHQHGRACELDADFILEPVNVSSSHQTDTALQLSKLVQVHASPPDRAQLMKQINSRDLSMEWFKIMPEILP